MNVRSTSRSGWCFYSIFLLWVSTVASQGCVGGASLHTRPTAELLTGDTSAVEWFAPVVDGDNTSLDRWRKSVGPPVLPVVSTFSEAQDAVTIVSWNTAVGDADIVRFVRTQADPRRPLVLLLQEVYRSGPEVPSRLDRNAAFAGRLGNIALERRQEIEHVGHELGLSVYYVPSMRNGGSTSDEDRGNAILSNLPLTGLEAIELPFERQRRVAIAANIEGRTSAGTPWRIRLVCAHLDNMGSAKRAWVGSEYGRARQARGLAALLHDEQPTILAGDFNTWFGFWDLAFTETARQFPQTRVTDRRATFRGLLRLDHVFYRLPNGWRLDVRRGESRFGSDHYPLVGSLHFS